MDNTAQNEAEAVSFLQKNEGEDPAAPPVVIIREDLRMRKAAVEWKANADYWRDYTTAILGILSVVGIVAWLLARWRAAARDEALGLDGQADEEDA